MGWCEELFWVWIGIIERCGEKERERFGYVVFEEVRERSISS